MAAYDPNDDPGTGGSHFTPPGTTSTQPTPYDPSQDPGVGSGQPGSTPPRPGILNSAWQNIQGGASKLWDEIRNPTPAQPGQAPATFGTKWFGPPSPDNDVAFQAGGARGVRNVWDKITEGAAMGAPGTEGGIVPPTDAQLQAADDLRRQNATDRAATYAKYGDNPSFHAGVIGGETTATLPATMLAGPALGSVVRMAGAPGVADFIAGSGGASMRGLPGLVTRAGSRALAGGEQGGLQGALTSDPSQPLVPQVVQPAVTGAGLGAGVGTALDLFGNPIKRLSGNYVGGPRVAPGSGLDPTTGISMPRTDLPATTVATAQHAQTLLNEGVPVFASQVSDDPLLAQRARFGAAIPGSGTAGDVENQLQSWRRAALTRVGDPNPNASVADNDFITNNNARIGTMYDNSVRAVPSVSATGPNGVPLNTDVAAIRSTIPGGLTPEQQGQIHSVLNDIEDKFRTGNGQVSGSDYQLMTNRKDGTITPLFDSDSGQVNQFGQRISAMLDARLRAAMTNDQSTLYDQANAQYRALRTVDAARDSRGAFTPADLYREAQNTSTRFGGAGTIDPIAQSGDAVITPTLSGGAGPIMRGVGTATPGMMALAAALPKLLAMDLYTGGATGGGVGAGVIGLNKALQMLNRSRGQAAVNTVLRGGGTPGVNVPQPVQRGLLAPFLADQQQSTPSGGQPYTYPNQTPP